MNHVTAHTTLTPAQPACHAGAHPAKSVGALAGISELVREVFGERVIQCAKQAAMLDLELLEQHQCAFLQFIVSNFTWEIETRAKEPNPGLLAAPFLALTAYGCSGRYALAAHSIEEAIGRAASTLSCHGTCDTLQLAVDGDMARISYLHARRGQRGYTHVACGTAALLLNLLRSYLGADFLPHRIELDIPRPSTCMPFEDVFLCPVVCGAVAVSVCLDAPLVRRQVHTRVPPAPITIQDVARALFDPLGVGSFLGIVVAHIRAQVQTGDVSIDDTARAMGTSVRTLQRLLRRNSGVDFRELANTIRLRVAKELLRGSSASITQVAMELGYSSPANFSRAFRTASGLTPQEYRRTVLSRPPCCMCHDESGHQTQHVGSANGSRDAAAMLNLPGR